jgi:uncharacterized protein
MSTKLSAILAGLLFGFGLALGGMTDTSRVLGFLNFSGQWDPALVFVLAFAVITTFFGYRWALKKTAPYLASEFQLPTLMQIDARLILGASVFGLGWGLYGYCPGPALSSMVYFQWQTFLFVFAMIAGMKLASLIP